jgi:hypothetical protein
MYALQKVQIRNTMPLEEAEKHYTAITKKKPRKVRETDNFYQFRYLPPTKFEKRSFRTKVVNDDIHLIFGKLKDEHQTLEGRGLFDYFTKGYDYVKNTSFVQSIKNAMTISDFSVKTKANLDKFGDYRINYIQIRRVPVSSTLELVLQGVSGGEWERLKKKYGFDHFFHLSMVVGLQGAKDIVLNTGRKMKVAKQLAIEKLEVVSVNENVIAGEGMETQDVPLAGKSFSINDMFRKARDRVGDETFFAYSALGKNNCQDFIALLLDVEGLYRAPEKEFIYQNISELVAELPAFTKGFAQTVTDLGALVNKATGIGGSSNTHRENFLSAHKLKDKGYSLKELSKISAVPLDILQQVYDRGIGAYKTNPTSVRLKGSYVKNVAAPADKKLSKEQWAMARVYSFLDGNPKHDEDLRANKGSGRVTLDSLHGGADRASDAAAAAAPGAAVEEDDNNLFTEGEDRDLVELVDAIQELILEMWSIGMYTAKDYSEQLERLQDLIQEEDDFDSLYAALQQFEHSIVVEHQRFQEEEIEAENQSDEDEEEERDFDEDEDSMQGDGKRGGANVQQQNEVTEEEFNQLKEIISENMEQIDSLLAELGSGLTDLIPQDDLQKIYNVLGADISVPNALYNAMEMYDFTSTLVSELQAIRGQGKPIVIPRKKFIKEHKHLIGMMDAMCKEGKDQAKELKEVGGNKASGFIRAVLAGKNEENPARFQTYNEEGFNVGKLSKITKNATQQHIPRMEPELRPVNPQGLVRDGVYAKTRTNKRKGHVYKDTPANRRLGRVGQMKPYYKNLKGTYEMPEITLQYLANQYYHTEGLAKRRQIKAQAVDAGFTEEDFNRALVTERKRVQRARDVEQGVVRQHR